MREEESNWGQRRDRRRNYEGPATEKPVKVGEEHEVTIEAVGSRGDGIAKVNNFVVFVPGGQSNSTVRVRITSVRERFATAEIIA
jgi:predicted RNA-binding protein with TRAM domain